jgi:cysteine synthase/rhodanese-related sulfurtransferase
LQQPVKPGPDFELLNAFEGEILARIPHLDDDKVANATPLLDLTQALKDCARDEYGLDLSERRFKVLGKLEAPLLGGSVKTRAAAQIVYDAIKSGRLKRGMVVFEATSGNLGIALGLLGALGIKVVVLVSRRLQEGVLEELERSGVSAVDLDVDVCPAPGMQIDPNLLLAKVVATNIRERFGEIGLDLAVYDSARARVEELLSRQDVINLAKLFAEVYHGFCPEQYDNEQNVNAHRTVTGPEIDQQLREIGQSLADYRVVCTFGTGGTSGGLSRYLDDKYRKMAVHVVFPPEGRDVAGIRTRSKASGLRFYEPQRYAGEHEVDFDQAKRLFGFLVRRGLDIGESSALALFAVLQMVNFGMESNFVVILADGATKYMSTVQSVLEQEEEEEVLEVTLESAKAKPERFDTIVWTHMGYVPSEEGSKLIASMLGRPDAEVIVASPHDVVRMITNQDVPTGLKAILEGDRKGGGKRALLVCMAGGTSLRAAQVLESNGIKSQSLTGGITRLAQISHKPLPTLVRPAKAQR